MNIINQFRRKARVVESTIDMKQVAAAAQQQDEYYTTICEDDYPIILTIGVQVKVCFVWVTVWSESCDVSDGDTRQRIEKRAIRLVKILEGKENGQHPIGTDGR